MNLLYIVIIRIIEGSNQNIAAANKPIVAIILLVPSSIYVKLKLI